MKKICSNVTKIFMILLLLIANFVPSFAKAQEQESSSNNQVTTSNKVTFDQTIGANGFIDDSMDVLSALATIREYHNYRWITEKFGETRYTQGTWWDFDEYYRQLYEMGITVMPCIQGTSKADRTNYNGNKQQKPINPGEDSTDPFSYSEHASTMFQYAARYGKVKVSEDKLTNIKQVLF